MKVNCVPFKIVVEGQEIEAFLTEKNWELVLNSINKNKKKTGYEPVEYNETYFYENSGNVTSCADWGKNADIMLYKSGNYYSNKTLAENNARADNLIRQLRRFAVERRDSEMNWENGQTTKYYILYSYAQHKLLVDYYYKERHFGAVYFREREDAELAIETFRDELMWYFTEYKDSL